MTVEKPVVGCLRLTPSQWKQLRALWKSQGGIKWMNGIIQREARKAAKRRGLAMVDADTGRSAE
jgi:hypothetical protein